MPIANPDLNAVLKAFGKTLVVLAVLAALALVASVLGFRYLFRVRVEPPVSDVVAMQRLEEPWLGPAPLNSADTRLLFHRKALIWDGTTHEEWVVFVSGDIKPDTKTAPFLRIEHPSAAWPLPESALAAGYQALPTAVYLAEGSASAIPPDRPTRTRAILWPVASGWIAQYEFTVID